MGSKIPVAVLGATGVVGQRFVARLSAHPNFELVELAASDANAGKRFDEACAWRLAAADDRPAFGGMGSSRLRRATPTEVSARVVFSALDTAPAREIEPLFAASGALVFSNASAFRMSDDVPLLIPEVNPEHAELVRVQRARRKWRGAIVCNTNCTVSVLAMALAPLERAFGVREVIMTSMQAVSGAGYPGVSSLDILGNVIPYIANEEEKLDEEAKKLLGKFDGERIVPAQVRVSAACHRVPVLDGHTEAVSVRLHGEPSPGAVAEVLRAWRPEPQRLGLFSAPKQPLRVHDEKDRPQVRRDVEIDGGMSVHIGRIRACSVLGIKFVCLGHNAERGAAGASVLNAELFRARGLFE